MAEKDKEGKKRKRQSNGTETPNKKVALEAAGTDSGKINVSYVEENGIHPVLLSTPGVNAPKVSFKAFAKARTEKAGGVKPKTHDLLLHSSQHPRLDYTAVPSTTDQHMSHYVAVYDPTTQQLQVVPAHHLSLQTTLRSETAEVKQDNLTYAQQREELGREFGTKKAKKAIASKTENAISQDPKGKAKVTDVQDAILASVGDATSGAASKNAEQDAEAAFASKPIPKPNLAAESVEEVYPLNTLIPYNDGRWVSYGEWQEAVREDKVIKFSHRYPASRVEPIAKAENFERLKALRYLTLLLEFHDSLSNAGRSGKKVPKKDILTKKLDSWPQNLVDSVRRRFTNDSGSELGKWQMDNLYTHICALSLFCDGWTTDTSDLKEDLKLDQKQISQYFHELGCKVSAPTESERNARSIGKAKAAITRFARLKLPLDFPKPRVGRRR